jgi:thiosulfate/3-mercaptopyruvate sulfurtransferase
MESLVSTNWLAEHLEDPRLVVIDASMHLPGAGRDAGAEYAQSHIPGAQFLNLATLVDKQSDVPQALPRPIQLGERLASLGVGPESSIVFYDDSLVKTSARAWYLCRAHGLQDVAILDGGLGKWKAESRALESGEPDLKASPALDLARPDSIRFKSDMLANIESCASQVIDARDAGRFSGEFVDHVHNMPSGHIPGSCNLPFFQLFNEDGTYKSPEELRELITACGIDPEKPVIATCGSGVTACVLLFALDRIGASQTALYDGSWIDWGNDPATPNATSVEQ